MKTKPIYKGYDREVLMAEWKPINKEHHRRIRNCDCVVMYQCLFTSSHGVKMNIDQVKEYVTTQLKSYRVKTHT
jgi:hypothetical protein